MTKETVGAGLRTLFEGGSVVGLSDVELLERFLKGNRPAAETAFKALVEWHGPMVRHVCREILGEANDADDAFQATFLVLARRARGLRKQSSLGPWLYGVAVRVARTARNRATRRRWREQPNLDVEPIVTNPNVDRLDEAFILHQEVGRLPEKYRTPLVLCYFEGLTHDQAASLLGWPVGTVRSRLARGRDLLRPRLTKRGLAPSTAILAAAKGAEVTSTLPATLVASTVQMALSAGTAGAVPVAVASIAAVTLREITIMKTSLVATSLVALTVLGTAGVEYVRGTAPVQVPEASKKSNPVEPTAEGSARTIPLQNNDDPFASKPAQRPPSHASVVLWARLNSASARLRAVESIRNSGRATYTELLEAQGNVDALKAELRAMADDLSDEVELLEALQKSRESDVEIARTQLGNAHDDMKMTKKLFEQKLLSTDEIRERQYHIDLKTVELARANAGLNEIRVRIKQATRRRDEALHYVELSDKLTARPKEPADSDVKK